MPILEFTPIRQFFLLYQPFYPKLILVIIIYKYNILYNKKVKKN